MAKFVSKVWRQFCGKHARTLFRRQTTLDSKIWTRTLLTAVSNKSHGGVLRMKLPAAALMSSNGDTTSNRVLFHTDNTLFLPRANADNLTAENLIEAWFNEVKPFGTLCVHDFPFDVHVQPLNPVDYPDANKSLVKVFYDAEDKEPLEGSKLSKLGNLCDMKVLVEEDGERVEVTCDVPSGVELPLVCVINVPINFDVEVKNSSGGRLTINNLESKSISVSKEHGDCHLVNLKTGTVNIQCDEGSITSSRQLLGAIHMRCGKHGSISADRFQGSSIQCLTESGDINIKTVYTVTSNCSSECGNLHIRDCHGDMMAKSVHGNLTVDSLDGKLTAELENGSADVFVTRQDGVNIHTLKGNITLRFTEDSSSSLHLDAQAIEQDESLKVTLDNKGKGFLKSETDAVVKASAPQGKISLKTQDWLSSMKLQFGNAPKTPF